MQDEFRQKKIKIYNDNMLSKRIESVCHRYDISLILIIYPLTDVENIVSPIKVHSKRRFNTRSS